MGEAVNHLAAFILRIAAQAVIDGFRYPTFPDPLSSFLFFQLLAASDEYAAGVYRMPMPLPSWMASINSTGGEA